MADPVTDPRYEVIITPARASDLLGLRIEAGDRAGRHYALSVNGATVFVNSRSPIEFAIRRTEGIDR